MRALTKVIVLFGAGVLVGMIVPRPGSSRPADPGGAGGAFRQDIRAVNGVGADGSGRVDVATPAPTQPADPPASLAERATRWTVCVRSGPAYGAGVLLTRDGLVLTALHVIMDDVVRVRLLEGPWRHAQIVARDEASDLALLRTDSGSQPPPEIASVLDLHSGDRVLSVGSPRQLRFTVSRGVVAFVGRRMQGARYIQTDISVQPGSSGGPVFDDRGRLVGIMSFALRGSERIGFVLPVDYAFDRFGGHLDAKRLGGDLEGFRQWTGAR